MSMGKEKLEEYVALVEIKGSIGRPIGFSFEKVRGYLDSLVDDGAISENIIQTEIWESKDIGIWFYDDDVIKEKILAMKNPPERYLLIRSKVIDKTKLNFRLKKLCGRFGFRFFYYSK